MEISIHSLLEGATRATGSVAVIDVFRAFTSAAVALANGALSIVMVRTVEEALALRNAGIGHICMGEVHCRAPPGFDFGNSPFEFPASISAARKSSSGPAPGLRALSPLENEPYGFTRPRWSRQRQPSVPFCRPHPIRFPSSLWGTMASAEPTRTNYARLTSETGSKADRAMQTLFAASSWPVAKSGDFTIRLVHTCTLRTWTSR
jgi:2-phosphosulpholactate phosphatase